MSGMYAEVHWECFSTPNSVGGDGGEGMHQRKGSSVTYGVRILYSVLRTTNC